MCQRGYAAVTVWNDPLPLTLVGTPADPNHSSNPCDPLHSYQCQTRSKVLKIKGVYVESAESGTLINIYPVLKYFTLIEIFYLL